LHPKKLEVPKKKLQRFAENETFPNLFQPRFYELDNDFFLKGKWNKQFFGDDHPIVLELGCGKGEYTIGLARNFSNKNFIGIDRKGARLWRGCKSSVEENLKNVAFLRAKIELIEKLFADQEVSEIWITFPDPQPKLRHARKRLTSTRFLGIYKKILKPGGLIHLKTDNSDFYSFTKKIITQNNYKVWFETEDLYRSKFSGAAFEIQTFYEEKFLEQDIPIKYIQFSIT
jgi:tRNA (guanine-N7-)-methyltransferase